MGPAALCWRMIATSRSCAISPASWLVGRCQIASNLLFGWAGSRHCRSVMEVCAALLSVTSCGEQWRGLWLNKCRRRSRIQLQPFQYALKTKSGCECVSHILQALTESSPRCTVMSVDGVGAFDLVSRNAMLRGLMSLRGRLLPFADVPCQPSVFLWEDEIGEVHHIQQGEGGEQGGPSHAPSVLRGEQGNFGGARRRSWRPLVHRSARDFLVALAAAKVREAPFLLESP